MKKLTTKDYQLLSEIVDNEIERLRRFSRIKYTDLDKLDADIHELEDLQKALRERLD